MSVKTVFIGLWLCLGMVFLGTVRPVLAQSNPWYVDETIPSLKNSNTYVMWIKDGTTNSSGNYSGDTVSIWTVDATGHEMAISPTYGPYAGWKADELLPAFDGTLRLAWTMGTGTTADTQRNILSYWTLDGTGNRNSISPTYGPYTGWHFEEAFPNPDGTSALYWTKNNYSGSTFISNQLSVWTVDSAGSQLTISPTYGPYTGWFFIEAFPSFNKDGTSFLTWVNEGSYDSNGNNYTGDQISVWKTDERGNQTSIGPTYGRYARWHFDELYPAYDGTARLLWTIPGTTDSNNVFSGDTASVWSIDATGHQSAVSPTYGPYTGWNANSIVASPSSTSRLLWIKDGTTDSNGNYSGDLASIWSLNAADVQTSISPTYTTPDGMLDSLWVAADGSERLTWEYGDNDTQLSVWSLDASNNRTATGPIYGPYK